MVVGLTFVDPDAETVPIPLSIDTVSAFVVVHVNIAWFPDVIVEGVTDSFAVGAAACTVMVAAEEAVPLVLVAIIVYCVVAEGETVMDTPEAATVPIPLLM